MYFIAVLIGNREQFDTFMKWHQHHEFKYVYIGRVEDVLGRNFHGMIVDGTFWERPDATDLHRAVIMHTKK